MYQPTQEHCQDVILQLEMEMNSPIFTTSHPQTYQKVYADVMSYVYANNDFQGGTLLKK